MALASLTNTLSLLPLPRSISISYHFFSPLSNSLHPSLHLISTRSSSLSASVLEPEPLITADSPELVISDEAEEETVVKEQEEVAPLPKYPVPELTLKEKKELASYAHSLGKKLKYQQVGKSGVTPAVAISFIQTLEANELLKLKVHGNCPEDFLKAIQQLQESTGSVAVSQIGRSVILYRPSLSKLKKEKQALHIAKTKSFKKPSSNSPSNESNYENSRFTKPSSNFSSNERNFGNSRFTKPSSNFSTNERNFGNTRFTKPSSNFSSNENNSRFEKTLSDFMVKENRSEGNNGNSRFEKGSDYKSKENTGENKYGNSRFRKPARSFKVGSKVGLGRVGSRGARGSASRRP